MVGDGENLFLTLVETPEFDMTSSHRTDLKAKTPQDCKNIFSAQALKPRHGEDLFRR